MSLRTFHLLFIVIVIICAEMFGARELWLYPQTKDLVTLWLGVGTLVGGLVLSVYALLFVRKMDRAGIY